MFIGVMSAVKKKCQILFLSFSFLLSVPTELPHQMDQVRVTTAIQIHLEAVCQQEAVLMFLSYFLPVLACIRIISPLNLWQV